MKKGDKVKFYLFGVLEEGVVEKVNRKSKTLNIAHGSVIYPNVETINKPPNVKFVKDFKPWYILKK